MKSDKHVLTSIHIRTKKHNRASIEKYTVRLSILAAIHFENNRLNIVEKEHIRKECKKCKESYYIN